ncbi:unnamed protein product [Pleuronectes platessa]|uniref:Myosin motor domain-containing protein n=1 Tax=Pleuronectes platessa TaxID=8262 RepID=A0A9N7Z1S5_PLEPL|nr:unnamed protein product [Pleuronectes platessa]
MEGFSVSGRATELPLTSALHSQSVPTSHSILILLESLVSRRVRSSSRSVPGMKAPSFLPVWGVPWVATVSAEPGIRTKTGGESGAGKTESTKLILKFLSAMSQHSLDLSSRDRTSRVEEALLESSPIMEAFGNATTVHNNNSSRFGQVRPAALQPEGKHPGRQDRGLSSGLVSLSLFALGFSVGHLAESFSSCALTEASPTADLLEKNRVVRQNPGERNYHIFYALLAGTNSQQRDAFALTHTDSYHYLRQSSCVTDKTINDKGTFQDVLNAMRTMQFTEENIGEILRLLAGILHAGNIEFMTAGGAQVSSKSALSRTSDLLGLNSDQLAEVLTHRSMILRGEEISTPLTVEQAVDSRDSMAMALYSQCFNWIIRKLNSRIRGNEDFKSISILDIFGFENFEVNRFEQFNINYANEKLQEYFNKHIFSLEQLEYNKEGLAWVDINWMDNGECLDLIEKVRGGGGGERTVRRTEKVSELQTFQESCLKLSNEDDDDDDEDEEDDCWRMIESSSRKRCDEDKMMMKMKMKIRMMMKMMMRMRMMIVGER